MLRETIPPLSKLRSPWDISVGTPVQRLSPPCRTSPKPRKRYRISRSLLCTSASPSFDFVTPHPPTQAASIGPAGCQTLYIYKTKSRITTGGHATACGNSAVFKSSIPRPDCLKIRGFPSPACAGFGFIGFPIGCRTKKGCGQCLTSAFGSDSSRQPALEGGECDDYAPGQRRKQEVWSSFFSDRFARAPTLVRMVRAWRGGFGFIGLR